MDKKEYLNQISSHPSKTRAGGNQYINKLQAILHSKFLWIAVGGLAALIVIVIIGSILGSGKGDNKERLYALTLHVDGLNEVISDYQDAVKSSDLRGYSASLSSILSNTSTGLNDYVTAHYNIKKKELPKTLVANEEAEEQKLSDELFEAKITGRLDQVYAQRMAIEIADIMNREETINASLSNPEIDEILESSYDSLANLYPKFNEFVGT